MAPRPSSLLRAFLATAGLLTAVCNPTTVPVANTKAGHGSPGGGVSGGLPDASVPDASVPDASITPEPPCYLCGASSAVDAGCPTGLAPILVATESSLVCICEDSAGRTGCELCSMSNPANGGCDAGTCTNICPPGGYFSLCVAPDTAVPDQCTGDAG